MRDGKLDEAFACLERAHVLGQNYVRPHVLTHSLMLRIAIRRREPLAVWGQAVRIVLGALGSAIGRVPTGNTGGTDVSMFRHMPIDPELSKILQSGAANAPLDARAVSPDAPSSEKVGHASGSREENP
jgi:hypothetical protein